MASLRKFLCCFYGEDDSTSTGTTTPDIETNMSEDEHSILSEAVYEPETETTDTDTTDTETTDIETTDTESEQVVARASFYIPRPTWDYTSEEEYNGVLSDEMTSDTSNNVHPHDSFPCWEKKHSLIFNNSGNKSTDNIRGNIEDQNLDMQQQFRGNEIFNEAGSSSTIEHLSPQALAKLSRDKINDRKTIDNCFHWVKAQMIAMAKEKSLDGGEKSSDS